MIRCGPRGIRPVCVAVALLSVAARGSASDWPTYGGDNRRSGVTDEKLALPLQQAWTYRTAAPRPAWPAPAKQDFWHNQSRLTPSITFDRAMHPVVSVGKGGEGRGAEGRVFFGSSAGDKVVCLDAATGHVRWSFFTEGPVRLAPSVAEGKVYAGSDDGHVYCLAADDGKLLWKYRVGPQNRRVPGNGRMISLWPVRCGPLVDAGTVWVCAGLFPTYGVYLCALDAADGTERWKRRLGGISPQGYMLASDTRLFVPCGRTAPAVFDRRDGKRLGSLLDNRRGGTYALVVDELVFHRGEAEGSLTVSDSQTRERIVSFDGLHLAVRDGTAFVHSERELAALDRSKYLDLARQRNITTARRSALEKQIKELRKRPDPVQLGKLEAQLASVGQELQQLERAMQACWIWKQPCSHPYSLVLAGDLLVVGGDNEVAALRTGDGTTAWKAPVTGKAHGLAVAAGRLLVSTDEGTIHCFGSFPDSAVAGGGPRAVSGKPPGSDLSGGSLRSTPATRRRQSPQSTVPKSVPIVRHEAPDRVVVTWTCDAAEAAAIEYWADDDSPTRLAVKQSGFYYEFPLLGLAEGTDYRFRIRWRDLQGTERVTPSYEFDSSCDLIRRGVKDRIPGFPDDPSDTAITAEVQRIASKSGVHRGYCLVLGCRRGAFALELARWTGLKIIVIEPDAASVDAARRILDARGVYGTDVVFHCGPLDKLPYVDHFANLIVSERTFSSGELPTPVAEVCRMLRPSGGVAWIGQPQSPGKLQGKLTRSDLEAWAHESPLDGWKIEEDGGLRAVLRRGRLPGAGQWTHLYADAGNSACSGDALHGPVDVQWFGRPGPRQMVDRHHRGMSPLAVGGRLFIAGNNRLKAVDAYNGTPLWELTIPHSRRVSVHRNSGHVVATEDRIYLAAENTCWAIDALTGRCMAKMQTPPAADSSRRHWGYLACVGDRLLGTAEKPGASYTDHQRSITTEVSHGNDVPMATSERLFCVDRRLGRLLWTYEHSGGSAILNAAIAAGVLPADVLPEDVLPEDRGRVYFIESRNPAAVADPDGRVALSVALAKGTSYLIALDQKTGEVVFSRAVDLSDLRHALYLSYARGTVLITGTYDQGKHPRYDLRAFDAETGQPKWSSHYVRTDKPAGGDHGEQDQHPVIVGGVVYSRPAACDLETGKQLDFNLDRGGHGCGTLSGSAAYLFGRGGNPRMYPLGAAGRQSTALTTVTRPGCWINIIPAGGLLLIPESSSGCSCPFSVQTSIALRPRR